MDAPVAGAQRMGGLMETTPYSQALLDATGGPGNVRSLARCMTRLRLELDDISLVDLSAIRAIHHVLSARKRGDSGVEVVFGPAVVNAVAEDMADRLAMPISHRNSTAVMKLTPKGLRRGHANRDETNLFARSGATQSVSGALSREDLERLRELLNSVDDETESDAEAESELADCAVLIVNGPNMNLLGVREPGIYGENTYDDLVELCHETALAEGFGEVRCYQSNHEGDLVDMIQEARLSFDGIVLNPAAYTHTSVALLDALKAVGLPCVEVHMSHVMEREGFRQTSYVREACLATVAGEGLEGYAHAIRILAEHLRGAQSSRK